MKNEFLLEDYRSITGQKKYLYLIIYDIVDNKRRNVIFKLLKSFGTPVQKSCFETYLTEGEFKKLETKLLSLIDKDKDNIRAYQLNGLNKVYNYGHYNVNAYEDLLIF